MFRLRADPKLWPIKRRKQLSPGDATTYKRQAASTLLKFTKVNTESGRAPFSLAASRHIPSRGNEEFHHWVLQYFNVEKFCLSASCETDFIKQTNSADMRIRKRSHVARNKIYVQAGDEYTQLSVRYGHNDAYQAHVFLHKDWGPKKMAAALRHFASSLDKISMRRKP